jgi:hypothetical protein
MGIAIGLEKSPTISPPIAISNPRSPAIHPPTIALLALAFAWGEEFSQLYHAPWIDTIRATILGKLALGNTFNWPDLPAYAVGIALGASAEWRKLCCGKPPTT